MTTRPASLLLPWLLLAAVPACGDDGGPADDGALPGAGRWAVPRIWEAGDRFGYAVIFDETLEPFELLDGVGDRSCAYDVQFAQAAVSGGLEVLDVEGECLVASDVGLVTLPQDQLDPLCADEVLVSTTTPGVGGRLDLCNPTGSLAPAIPLSCAQLAARPDRFSVESGVGSDPADTVTMLDVTVDRPATPVVTEPALLPSRIDVWQDGPFEVGWEVPLSPADHVEVRLRSQDGTGAAIRCLTADDGAFTVPERLLDGYRDERVVVELVRTAQRTTRTDGMPFRISFQVQTAFQLNPRAGR